MSDRQEEENRACWRKVGWHAHAFGLPAMATDTAVLRHEKCLRGRKLGLDRATWFDIFCVELREGMTPTVPDYCAQGDANWSEYPPKAFEAAQKAAEIFLAKK